METTRKNQIEKQIIKYTTQNILDRSLDFEECSAYNIALDLKLDRSNVSRLMNQLFSESKLIKIEGRPTLYISKKIINEHFQFIQIPQVIKKDDLITNYFSYDSNSSVGPLKLRMDIIGADTKGSLHSAVHKLMPAIYYMTDNTITLVIHGNQGVGKKYLATKLFKKAQEIRRFNKKNRIFTCDYTAIERNPELILQHIQPEVHKMIILEVSKSINETTLLSFLDEVQFLYENIGKNLPLFSILINSGITNHEFLYALTPYIVYIPNIKERPIKETIEWIIFYIQQECDKLNKKMNVNKNLIHSLTTFEYRYNYAQLHNEVIYAISNCIFHASDVSNEAIFLDNTYLSEELHTSQTLSMETINRALEELPQILNFYPGEEMPDFKNIKMKKQISIMKKKANTSINNMYDYLVSITTSFSAAHDYKVDANIESHILNITDKTILTKDPALIYNLCAIVNDIINGDFRYSNFNFDESITISSLSLSLAKKVINFAETIAEKLQEPEKQFIIHYISTAITMLTNIKTPILIVCHGQGIAEGYARLMNQYTKKRSFYSLDYDEKWQQKSITSFSEEIFKTIYLLNKGNNVLLIVDNYPLTTLDSSIVLNTKIMVSSLYPASVPLFYNVINLVKKNEFENMMSLSYSFIAHKKEMKNYMKSQTLLKKENRTNDPHLKWMISLFPTLDTNRTNEIFFTIINNISEELYMHINNALIVDFIFYGNCILEMMLNKNYKTENYKHTIQMDNEIVHIIKDKFDHIPDLSLIDFEMKDFAILSDCIYKNLNNQ